ncbi:hypothetical protein ACE6ED_27065 [Paenibacillus sp. CN-4]|uniref:hypothetical protein n=1 Tax=Paenibacillus nanchangensis TaxID=3348343 RepID=UPI003978171F
MRKTLEASWAWIYTALFGMYIVESLTGSEIVRLAEGALCLLALAVSLPGARLMFRVISLAFFAAGTVCILWSGAGVTDFLTAMTSNGVLFALLFVLPSINRTIRVGGYARNLSRWLSGRSDNLGLLFVRSTVVSYIMSLFLFLAAVPLAHSVLDKQLKGQPPEVRSRFMAMTILRGYGTVAVWSPVEPLVAMAAVITGASYLSLLPFVLLVSALLLLFTAMTGRLRFRGVAFVGVHEETAAGQVSGRSFAGLFAGLALLILAASGCQLLLGVSFFEALTFVMVPFACAWAAVRGRLRRFLLAARAQWPRDIAGLPNLLVLFMSFGLFNGAVKDTPIPELLAGPVSALAGQPLLLYVIMAAAGLLLPVAGVHPLVIMGLFGVILQPVLSDLPPVSVAVVMIVTSLASSSMGTFNTTVALLSGLLQLNPYRITWWNFGYGVVFAAAGVAAGLLLL